MSISLPRSRFRSALGIAVLAVCTAAAVPVTAQTHVTTPREALGFTIGDDYHLATYAQLQGYWTTLAAESPRMVLDTIGMTAEGRPQLMAIITAPENHRNLARYQAIARRLALAEGLSDEQARALAEEGRAVVWIDGGLHATEVLGAHQLMELVYRMVSGDDAETRRTLRDVILLAVHANPDGMDLVSEWYMRESDPLKRSTRDIPRLYQKYVGHDNNRDFYLVAQPETENMARVLFREWFPQIMYNHHQTGPTGTVMFAPPFRDPFNYNIDPMVWMGIEMVGAAMHGRFVAEGKPGTTMRRGASYSAWWNGGLRTTTYFHNMIGLLTETKGHPTPIEIEFRPERQLPSGDTPYPIAPHERWHFRQSIEYSMTANRAVLDYASRYRETVLYNIYRMGRNSIERGNRDHWTVQPTQVEAVEAAIARDPEAGPREQFGRRRIGAPMEYFALLREPARRDPRGYIVPADQPDFPTAAKFVNALIKNGVTVHRATRAFQVGGKAYPAGSFVVKTAQAFRPHVLDMFEPQDHPNDFEYPGGPPIAPYDNAGYTLAYQMGVQFDRMLEGFDGPFEPIAGPATPAAGTVARADGAAGFLVSHRVNDAVVVTNRLLAANRAVYWLTTSHRANGKSYPAGTIYIPAASTTPAQLRGWAAELGVSFDGVRTAPGGEALRLRPVRIGLWDRYGGSMPSGWTRWLLEQFEFPFEVVYPQRLDAGNLADAFDVLVFPTDAIPDLAGDDESPWQRFTARGPDPATIPEAYRSWLGRVTSERTVPRLLEFLNAGGTIITIGTSTSLARHAGLPVANHLVGEDGKPLSRSEYYVPGSVLQVRVDTSQPITYGLPERLDVFFDNSPVMRLTESDVQPVAWFDTARPLRSGWAWGQERLQHGVAAATAQVGRGTLYLLGPEVLHRGQPHGTFQLVFNGIFLSGARPVATAAAGGG